MKRKFIAVASIVALASGLIATHAMTAGSTMAADVPDRTGMRRGDPGTKIPPETTTQGTLRGDMPRAPVIAPRPHGATPSSVPALAPKVKPDQAGQRIGDPGARLPAGTR